MITSDVMKTVVNETAAEGVKCLPMTIAVTQPLYRLDEQWVGIGFALGFLLGCGMGLFVALNCCRSWFSSHRKVDVESQNYDKKTKELAHYVRETEAPSYNGYENTAFTSTETDVKYLEHSSRAGSFRPMSITPSSDDGSDRSTSAMTSALIKDSSEALAAEIARQDVEATSRLENELWRDRNMLLMQVMQMLLNRLHKTGKITTEGATSMQLNLRNNLNNVVRTLDQERQAAELRINADDSLSLEAVESELERLQTDLVYKMNNSVKDEEERIRRDLVKVAGLSEKEAESAMIDFLEDMTRADAMLAQRYAHESQKIQHQLSQRLLAAELASQRRAYQNEEIQANVFARGEAINETAKNNYKLKLYADELMADYEKTVLKLQEKSEAVMLKQQAMLVERLQEKRATELAEVEKAMAAERQSFIARTEKMIQTTDMEKAYKDYIEKQKRQMYDVLDEIDISETNEFDQLLKDVKIQRDKELQAADEAFINKLQDHMSLSAGDVTQLLQAHLAHMRNFTRTKELERQQYAAILQDRLSDREKRWQEEYAATEAEQISLAEYQDAAVMKVIDTQVGLDTE